MKNIILILMTLSIIAISCNDDNQEPSIYGTWQLGAIASGGISFFEEDNWVEVEDGFTIELKRNRNFVSNEFEGCLTGNFRRLENEISFIYGCENFTDHFLEQ